MSVANLLATVIIAGKHGVQGGPSSIFQGDCSNVGKADTVAHTVINVFGAVNLAASSCIL